jgi:hypothetical protein
MVKSAARERGVHLSDEQLQPMLAPLLDAYEAELGRWQERYEALRGRVIEARSMLREL